MGVKWVVLPTRALFAQPQKEADAEPDPLGLVHTAHAAIQGELVCTVVSRHGEGVLVAYRFRDPAVQLEITGQAAAGEAETVKKDLSRQAFAQMDQKGWVVALFFDPAASKTSKRLTRALLAALQFALPEASGPRLSSWEAREEGPSGEYLAHYEVEPEPEKQPPGAGFLTISKRKTKYVEPERTFGSGELRVKRTVVPDGEFRARWNLRGGHLASLEGSETHEVLLAGKAVARSKAELRLEFQGRRTIPPDELAALREASAAREKQGAGVPLRDVESDKEGEAALRRAQLGGATPQTLLAELAKVEASGASQADTSLYLQLKALVYLQPEACAGLGRVLVSAEAKGPTMKAAAGALGAVGHAEAQAALASAIQVRPRDWPALWALIPPLGMVSSPTPEAEAALWPLASDASEWNIRSTAQLALGMMARSLARSSPMRAASIVRRFLDALEKSASPKDARQALLVLGNAGTADVMPAMVKFLAHSDPGPRGAAAWGLRWIESGQVDALLAKTLREDAESSVRREAVAALRLRPPTPAALRAQEQALLHDPEAAVRLAVLDNLWRLRGTHPTVRPHVERAAREDPSEDVRRAAAKLLESDGLSGADVDAP